VLLTAFGYDYVPGNLAGALALQAAGPATTRVRVGYFVRGNIGRGTSAGTRASVAGVLLEPGYAFRSGRIVSERSAAHVMSFEIGGKRRQAFSGRCARRSRCSRPTARGCGWSTTTCATPRTRRRVR
jgi:hypothetical protein